MSTEVVTTSPPRPKRKKSTNALGGSSSNVKSSEQLDGSGGRKSRGDDSKGGKGGKGEGDGEKRPRKPKLDSNGNGSLGAGSSEAPSSAKSSKKHHRATEKAAAVEISSSEEAPPSKPPKNVKKHVVPIVVHSSPSSTSDSESSTDEDASAALTPTSAAKKPAVPPKPTKASTSGSAASPTTSPATAPRKQPPVPKKPAVPHDDDDESETSSSESAPARSKPSSSQRAAPPKGVKVTKERGSCEASTLSSEEESSEAPHAPVSTSSTKLRPPHDNGKARKPSHKEPTEETSSTSSNGHANLSTDSPLPSTSSHDPKPSTTAPSSGKTTKTGAAANSSGATTAAVATSSHHKEPKEKKFKGIFGLFKPKKSKEGKGSGDKSGHLRDTREKDIKEGTPEKRRTEEEKKTYTVATVADLPEDIQKKLKKSHLDEAVLNKHFDVLCNVLHFLTKHSFRIPDQEKEVRERRPYASQEMMDNAKQLLETTDNVKKFYKNIEFSGKGGFGRVFAAKDIATKKRVAIKKLPHATDKDKKNNYCEIAFLSTCNHPNIVKFNRAWEFDDKQEVWIVTEFLEGGTLSEAVKVHQFTERHIAYVAREILKALKYLHSLGYIHRDLKSGNVMMSIEGQIKLIDFGLCCDTVDGDRLQMLGSPYWIPPEMIKKKRHGCPADIWSFAVCVLEMYLKEPPHSDSRLFAMFTAASAGLASAIPPRASENARDFLSKCLEINPKKRWTADQLLAHPFVTAPKLEEGIRDVLRGVFVSNSLALSGI